MAVRLYEPISAGAELQLWSDPRVLVKTEIQALLDDIVIIQGYDDPVRERLAYCTGYQTLEEYDDYLRGLEWDYRDQLDFFDYDTRVANITTADGAWFSPIAVTDFCAERVGDEAVNAIDGNTLTFWQDDTDHPHQITFQLRSYPKRISKLRIYRGTNVRSALENLTVQIANSIPGLDDPANVGLDNVTPTWVDDAWNVIDLTKEQVGIYIRLTGFTSGNSLNQSRIREIEAWVETQLYD